MKHTLSGKDSLRLKYQIMTSYAIKCRSWKFIYESHASSHIPLEVLNYLILVVAA